MNHSVKHGTDLLLQLFFLHEFSNKFSSSGKSQTQESSVNTHAEVITVTRTRRSVKKSWTSEKESSEECGKAGKKVSQADKRFLFCLLMELSSLILLVKLEGFLQCFSGIRQQEG